MINKKSACDNYNKTNVQAEILEASPHRLIQILMENVIEKIGKAKICINDKNTHDKGIYISLAITIVDGLKSSINFENGGDIANNLDNLYDYMMRRLVEANLKNDIEILDEIIKLMLTIKSGWDEIPQEFHNMTNEQK